MESQYRPVSASIHLDYPAPPFTLEALYNPKTVEPRLSRVLFHETVHFWQYLNSGYLMRLVEESWERMLQFERTGRKPAAAPRRSHYVRPAPEHGMSPRDLTEVFVRFWDVQVVGPPELLRMEVEEGIAPAAIVERYHALEQAGLLERHPVTGGYTWESFELAMAGPGGAWAEPYGVLLEVCPPRAASVFFPVAVSLALKTDDPVRTYAFLMSGAGGLEQVFAAADSPHQLWAWCLDFLQSLFLALPCESRLGTGIEVVRKGALGTDPFWKWMAAYAERAAAELGARGACLDREQATERGRHGLGLLLACPGDPDCRGLLVPLLSPVRVTYADGTSWCPGKDGARSLQTPEDQLAIFDQVSALSGQIEERWEAFRAAPLGRA